MIKLKILKNHLQYRAGEVITVPNNVEWRSRIADAKMDGLITVYNEEQENAEQAVKPAVTSRKKLVKSDKQLKPQTETK